jgi:hypothetical protein
MALTTEQCQKKLFQLGVKLGVSPKLIASRLLSKDDKDDMLKGLLDDEMLEVAVKAWMDARMPDYANGHTSPYVPRSDKPLSTYRGTGKSV